MESKEILTHIMYAVGLLLTTILSGVAAWISNRMRAAVDEVNDAVNHRHKKAGEGAPKLYDAILHLHEKTDTVSEKTDELISWKRGYDGGSLDSGRKVEDFVGKVEQLNKQLEDLQKRPPCAIHDDRLNALNKLVKLHENELSD